MTLTIDIKINGRRIGGAIAHNVSRMPGAGDYRVEVVEAASPHFDQSADFHTEFPVEEHSPGQSLWKLVSLIANRAVTRQAQSPGESGAGGAGA